LNPSVFQSAGGAAVPFRNLHVSPRRIGSGGWEARVLHTAAALGMARLARLAMMMRRLAILKVPGVLNLDMHSPRIGFERTDPRFRAASVLSTERSNVPWGD
jgi:hypothetical protein